MAQSALEVANAALYKLGATIVTSVTVDTTKEGVVIAARLEPCKRSLLRMHPWNFAIKRDVLLPPASVTLTTPFVEYVSANTIKFTVASHTFVAGNFVTGSNTGITEANLALKVTGTTATTVTVESPGATAITGTPAAGTIRLSPAFDYTYIYALPSDNLRLIEIDGSVAFTDRWRVEGRNILSDEATSAPIKYVYDVTDYTLMDIEFYECLATYLAWDICDHITGDDNKKRALWTDLHGGDGKVGILPRARFADATEDSQQIIQTNDWVGSRLGGSSASVPAVFLG